MKNEKKFAFLVRKSNEALYDSCLKSLQSLRLPAGYEAELFTLTAEAPYAVQANKALALSDAKYKIYINDDLRLVYAHLLEDLPAIFENESIGMVGALGSRSLPTDGNVLGADDKQGAVYVPAKTRLSELRPAFVLCDAGRSAVGRELRDAVLCRARAMPRLRESRAPYCRALAAAYMVRLSVTEYFV